MRKTEAIESISKLSDEISLDEIVETLIIVEKIEKARQQIKEGKTSTEEEAKVRLSKWLN